jgi:transcriptional regulator with XRE-family HTH domain
MTSTIAFDHRAFRAALAIAGFRSVAELARRAGISESYGRQIANGLIPALLLRERLASLLGRGTNELWRPWGSPQGGIDAA